MHRRRLGDARALPGPGMRSTAGTRWSVGSARSSSLARGALRIAVQVRVQYPGAGCTRYALASLDETAASAQDRHPASGGRPAMWPVVFPAGITGFRRL
jgi:hypothetical protein